MTGIEYTYRKNRNPARRIAIIGLFFVGVFFTAWQSRAEPMRAVMDATPEQGLEMVRETAVRFLASIEEEGLDVDIDQGRFHELIDEIVFGKFDFHRISARVLGRGWRKASPQQKEQFIEQFKRYLIHTYASALSKYGNNQKIEYLPVRAKQSARTIKVRTRVQTTETAPIHMDYVLSLSRDGSWKVVDMLVEGVSLVVTHRSAFQTRMKQEGLPELIANLAARNRVSAESLNGQSEPGSSSLP